MRCVFGFLLIFLVIDCVGTSRGSELLPPKRKADRPLLIGDLKPQFDKKTVTVKFTITKLQGIAGAAKEGQAPSFAIATDGGKQKNVLSVWIEGDLANVLDRLQLAAFQENQLKPGTTIIATGTLRVHTMDPKLFTLSVTKWQDFRILPKRPKNRREFTLHRNRR